MGSDCISSRSLVIFLLYLGKLSNKNFPYDWCMVKFEPVFTAIDNTQSKTTRDGVHLWRSVEPLFASSIADALHFLAR